MPTRDEVIDSITGAWMEATALDIPERKRPCRVGVNGGWGRFRQETGLLMLFRDGPQGYALSRAHQAALDLGNAG